MPCLRLLVDELLPFIDCGVRVEALLARLNNPPKVEELRDFVSGLGFVLLDEAGAVADDGVLVVNLPEGKNRLEMIRVVSAFLRLWNKTSTDDGFACFADAFTVEETNMVMEFYQPVVKLLQEKLGPQFQPHKRVCFVQVDDRPFEEGKPPPNKEMAGTTFLFRLAARHLTHDECT